MNLPDVHQRAMSFMARFFSNAGQLPTTFFAFDAEQRMHLLVTPQYAAKRDLYGGILRAYFVKHGITAYGWASEGWATFWTHTEGNPTASAPSNRVEVITSCAVDRSDVIETSFRIIRDPGRSPRIGPVYRPKGVKLEDKKVFQRVGMCALLDNLPAISELDPLIENVLHTALSLKELFPLVDVMTPAEYEETRN